MLFLLFVFSVTIVTFVSYKLTNDENRSLELHVLHISIQIATLHKSLGSLDGR